MKRPWMAPLLTVSAATLVWTTFCAAGHRRRYRPARLAVLARARNTTASAARRACRTRSTRRAARAATCSGSATIWAAGARRSCCAASSTRSCGPTRARRPKASGWFASMRPPARRFGNRGTTSGRATCPIRASAGRASSAIRRRATSMPSAPAACLSATTATPARSLWSIPLHEQMGLLSTYGGRTNFPVVFEDLVILGSVIIGWGDMAMPAHRFMAFDKRDRPDSSGSSARGCVRRTRSIPRR